MASAKQKKAKAKATRLAQAANSDRKAGKVRASGGSPGSQAVGPSKSLSRAARRPASSGTD